MSSSGIKRHFEGVEDPRTGNAKEHLLIDIIVIAIMAVICGADSWVEIEEFGKAKQEWLESFLELPNGIPSHDTFGRVFSLLDPEQFQAGFRSWIGEVMKNTEGEVIAIDGKTLRRSHDQGIGKAAITMVSAWATGQQLVLGQEKVDSKSNEITAIPKLLELLNLKGCIVTIDAMGTQRAIAGQIIEQEADYILSLKGNQGHLHEDIIEIFSYAQERNFEGMTSDYCHTLNKGHGRIEIRECWTLSQLDSFAYIRHLEAWPGLQTAVMLRRERRIGDQREVEDVYYISSLPPSASPILEAVRDHWKIENGLHWVLDIAFREDESRIRKGFADQNFSLLRQLALSLLKQEPSARCGTHAKRLKAGWDHSYLLKVLTL
jgi:predicted transposase YbfD/YdcC